MYEYRVTKGRAEDVPRDSEISGCNSSNETSKQVA